MRAYGKYLRQIGFAFSQPYIEDDAGRPPAPRRPTSSRCSTPASTRLASAAPRRRATAAAATRVERSSTALDAIPSLDDDRICRAFLTLIDATVRTNYYRGPAGRSPFKLDPAAIPELPLPRPTHEIWVCGPRVEGVHLRGGDIARGGLRWSDRREDFRTEVLGLMKAQMVKNAVIVPTGAKGGFVVKRPPADPEALRAEVVDVLPGVHPRPARPHRQPRRSAAAVAADAVVHPPDTVVHDGDDTYLVVAADKGTATFSDIANEIAVEYGFWLGDAFASGGSAGYDHKAMGITARGAWESVRRHARVLGKDADRDPLTAVGIGDMSGDVFGNGMLRSRALRLVAAFDHRHVFIDPDPDPAAAFAERQRLFELPRSSWADYDPALISAGGGVYPRTLKSIELSAARRARRSARRTGPLTPERAGRRPSCGRPSTCCGTAASARTSRRRPRPTPTSATGPTTACASTATSCAAGWSARAATSGSPSSAGSSTRSAAGSIYTDAIDNSAGVDCSDHEVNIKILLDGVVDAGELTTKQRNELLGVDDRRGRPSSCSTTTEAQTLALMIARRQALPMVNVHARYIDALEAEGWLDRALEFLPTDKQIAERQAAGSGLHDAGVRRADRLHEERQRRRDRRRTDLPDDRAARGRPRRLLPAGAARRASPTRSAATRCAGRSSPPGSSTRWSTCRGSRSTTA